MTEPAEFVVEESTEEPVEETVQEPVQEPIVEPIVEPIGEFENPEALDELETPTSSIPLILRVCAEFVGTFLVCFLIYAAYTYGAVMYQSSLTFILLVTALSYTVVTALFSRFALVHLNPAVTVGSMLTSTTSALDGLLYVIAQVVGAIAAGGLIKVLLPTSDQVEEKTWYNIVVNGFSGGSTSFDTLNQLGVEFGIAFAIVVEVIACVLIVATALNADVGDGEHGLLYALAIGIAYGVGAAITYPITGAALNPARSTGIAIFSQNIGLTQQPLQQLWVFWIAPILAAALVALVIITGELISSAGQRAELGTDTAIAAGQAVAEETFGDESNGEETDTVIVEDDNVEQDESDDA